MSQLEVGGASTKRQTYISSTYISYKIFSPSLTLLQVDKDSVCGGEGGEGVDAGELREGELLRDHLAAEDGHRGWQLRARGRVQHSRPVRDEDAGGGAGGGVGGGAANSEVPRDGGGGGQHQGHATRVGGSCNK